MWTRLLNDFFINNVTIEVTDTGRGIPQDELPYIFDRFYKVNKTGKKNGAGTWLGLAIVKEILKAHTSPEFDYASTSFIHLTA